MSINALLDRLLLWQKFLILASISLVVVAIPTALYLREVDRSLDVAAQEMSGLAPTTAVMEVIHLTQQHRGLTAVSLSGASGGEERRSVKQRDAESAYARVDEMLSQTQIPDLSAAWAKARADWNSLRSSVNAHSLSVADSYAAHTALVAELLIVGDQVADHFGLSRDPDPDLDHLLKAMFYHLPYLTEETGRLRASGFALLSGHGSEVQRAELALTVGRIEDRLKLAGIAWRKATANNNDLAGLNAKWTEAERLTDGLSKLTSERIVKSSDSNPVSPADFLAQATAVIDAQFAADKVGVERLQTLIAARVASEKQLRVTVLAAMFALVFLASVLGRRVARSISIPMAQAVKIARRIAHGDLSMRFDVTGRSETAQLMQALQEMNDGLRHIVAGVRASAHGIDGASSDLQAGNLDLSARTESQASSLEETASSMEEITATVRQSLANARRAETMVTGAAQMAEHGGGVVSQVVNTMDDINAASKRVVDIIGVIEGIAFQTNILALNAAIEAGRAGTQGRGFAVVAAEVRQLAQRSAAAASEVKEVIAHNVRQVEAGNAMAKDAGQAMVDVLESIRGVTAMMSEIASAAQEQTLGIEQVNEAVVQIDRMTQQNAALVEQAAAASQALNQEAETLTRAVAVFSLDTAPVEGNPTFPARLELALAV